MEHFLDQPPRLVTHNSLREHTNKSALIFRWAPANSTLEEVDTGEVSQFLADASIQVCVVSHQCDSFFTNDLNFLDEAVHEFNRYLMDNEKNVTTLITSDNGK